MEYYVWRRYGLQIGCLQIICKSSGLRAEVWIYLVTNILSGYIVDL